MQKLSKRYEGLPIECTVCPECRSQEVYTYTLPVYGDPLSSWLTMVCRKCGFRTVDPHTSPESLIKELRKVSELHRRIECDADEMLACCQ